MGSPMDVSMDISMDNSMEDKPLFYVSKNILSTGASLETGYKHHLDIPKPRVIHKTLDNSVTDRYDEILIIGPVHGCYHEMKECIDKAHRDSKSTPNKILKIFVGDLVFRKPCDGLDNKKVIDYMMQNENVLSVRGNEDELVWMPCDNNTLNKSQREYLLNLPLTIILEDLDIIIVHAGLLPRTPLTTNEPFFINRMRYFSKHKVDNRIVYEAHKEWIDERGMMRWGKFWPGPEHIYFGHDSERELQMHKNATGLDTCCVNGKRLTAIYVKGPYAGTRIEIEAKKVYCGPKKRQRVKE